MKKLLLAAAGLMALGGSAFAADIPPPVYKAAPPPAPVYNWTGFYLNAGGGYGMWTADTTTVIPAGFPGAGNCILCVDQIQGGRGWLGTVGGGFDYQATDHIVLGVLADYDFSRIRGTIQDQGPFFAGRINENWSWAAGARAGWLITPQILSYINGGFSQTHFNSATMVITAGIPGLNTGFVTPAFTQSGWFLGGGTEVALAGLLGLPLPPGLFMRSEYRFAQYRSHNIPDTCPGNCFGVAGGPPLTFATITFHPAVQTITTSLVYKFNWH